MQLDSVPIGVDGERAGEEMDLWWGAYAGRKMLPEFVLCGAITAIFFGLAWYFREWHGNLVRYVVQLTMASLWIMELARWIHRLIATNYRLTSRRLLYCAGLYWPVRRDIKLAQVGKVVVEQTLLDPLLGVGRICIQPKDNSGPLIFEAVRSPQRIAREIEKQVRLAESQTDSR